MKKLQRGILFLLATLIVAMPLRAGDIYWAGTTGDFNDPLNWGGAVPGASDQARVNNGGTALISGDLTANPEWMLAGFGAGTSGTISQSAGNVTLAGGLLFYGYDTGAVGNYNLSGGTLTLAARWWQGWGGTGNMTVTGGTINSTGTTYIGVLSGGTGTLTMSGNAKVNTSNGDFDLGFAGGIGTVTLSDKAALSTTGYSTNIGGAPGNTSGSATVTMTGTGETNSPTWVSNNTFIGQGLASGLVTMSSYSKLTNTSDLQLANTSGYNSAATTGTLVLHDHASINQTGYIVGGAFVGATATLTMHDYSSLVQTGGEVWIGTLDAIGTFTLNDHATFSNTGTQGTTIGTGAGSGTLNLNGNSVYETVFIHGAANGAVNLDGGTLKAANDESDWLGTGVKYNVKAGGAIIKTDYNVQANGSLVGDPASPGGGLTKIGSGTLTIAAVFSYTGNTNVNEGTLALGSAGELHSNLTTVSVGSALKGLGTIIGDVVVHGTHAPGNSPGVQTVQGNYVLDGNLVMDIAGVAVGTDYDQVLITGPAAHSVSLSGALDLDWTGFSGSAGDSRLWIVKNDTAGTLSGAFSNYANGAALGAHDGSDWQIWYGADFATGNLTGGNDIVLAAVPEPSSLALLALGLASVFAWRRKRKAS